MRTGEDRDAIPEAVVRALKDDGRDRVSKRRDSNGKRLRNPQANAGRKPTVPSTGWGRRGDPWTRSETPAMRLYLLPRLLPLLAAGTGRLLRGQKAAVS